MESVLSVTKTLLGKSRLSPAGSTGKKQALSSRFNWEKADVYLWKQRGRLLEKPGRSGQWESSKSDEISESKDHLSHCLPYHLSTKLAFNNY